ncbi:MAG TPA: heme-binding protein [Gammaproteobacteria bacterium]|nr:heme-binding protein [Gammaproteobacteria bacterium]
MNALTFPVALILAMLLTAGCSGGSGGSAVGADPTPGCSGNCAGEGTFLTSGDVQTVIAQAVFEAQAQGEEATIAVVDRVGNVLAVYRMGSDAPREILVATRLDDAGNVVISGGLEGIRAPIDTVAAIAKAVTGAYLSSEGNAFSTRTANQIVQENFNPGEMNQPSGPLFGVQFSQLPCSDFTQSFNGSSADAGPKRSPLGLSADPGGFPLYKGGTVVGGVGVIADGLYGIDAVISDLDRDTDEMIALAGTFGFGPPLDRRGDRITVDGKTFRFSDVEFEDLATDPSTAPAFATLTPTDGELAMVTGYTAGVINEGTTFGAAASGIRADGGDNFPGQDAFVFVDAANVARFPPRDATDAAMVGAPLSASEVRTLLSSALAVANRARAQIRRPVGSSARVTISVVDTQGEILGMVRTRDAPVFGADVSLQKARTAAFFSSAGAGAFLDALPDARYLLTTGDAIEFGDYVRDLRAFLGDPGALASGEIAFSDRAGGNLARPFFPDGLSGTVHGPLSKPQGEWSPFSTGLQLDLANNAILQHALFVLGAGPDVGDNCAGVALADNLTATPTVMEPRIANGLQIFPGSVPIYRGDTLVGGIGVSGDGIDQDDMIAFLGLHEAGLVLGGAIGNAAPSRRADTLTPRGVRLRYVQCPQSPFVNSDEDNVCDGK